MDDIFDSKEIIEIRDEPTWEKLVNQADKPVMVEFFVTWCPHCQREAPIIDGIARQIKESGVDLYHANAEVMYMMGAVYDLEETPSFILVENGELKAKHEGFLTEDELIAFSQGQIGALPPTKDPDKCSRAFK